MTQLSLTEKGDETESVQQPREIKRLRVADDGTASKNKGMVIRLQRPINGKLMYSPAEALNILWVKSFSTS